MFNHISLYFGHQWASIHHYLLQTFHTNDEILKYVLIGYTAVILLGIVLGSQKVIAVYNNFDDVGQVFIAILMPVVCYFLFTIAGPKPNTVPYNAVKLVGIVLEGLYVFMLFCKTWKRNRSIFKTLLAFITKMSLASLLVLNVVMIFMGSTRKKEATQQGALIDNGLVQSLVMTGVIAMLIIYLVDDKGLGTFYEMNRRFINKEAA